MSSRTPPIPRSALSDEQRKVYDKVHTMCSTGFGDVFSWKDENSSLIGPMSALLHTPGLAKCYIQAGDEARDIPGLSKQAREVAILVTGVRFQSKYEIYAHERLAHATGLTRTQIETIKSGKKPEVSGTWDDHCDSAFDVATALTGTSGPLSVYLWDRAVETLGRDGTLALIQFVALYSYTCIILNAVDEPAPESVTSENCS